jgi:DNA-binding IclR family transcriptional regulator
MSDLAESKSRLTDIINFLAARPAEAYTLSELAAQLGLSNGSAHRALTMLTEARYLSRHPKHKTYSLGTALVAIGQAALEQHRGIELAQREMTRLAEEIEAQCVITTVMDDEILMLAKAGIPRSYDAQNRVGERRPFVPPLDPGQVAWVDKKNLNTYLARAPTSLTVAKRNHLLAALKTIRARGFSIAAYGPGMKALRQLTALPRGWQQDAAYQQEMNRLLGGLSEAEIQLLDLAEAAQAGLSYIAAPIFSPDGRVSLELTLSGMPGKLTPADIMAYAERLCAAASVVTTAIHGRMPR